MKKVYYIMANYGAFGWKLAGGPYPTYRMAKDLAELFDMTTRVVSWAQRYGR